MGEPCATSVLGVQRIRRLIAFIAGVYHERQLIIAVERMDNLLRRGSLPRLSVILVVEGSPSYAMRALESVQNQDLYDMQIVVACRNAAPGVRHSLDVAAGRDIHIDLIDVDDPSSGACLREGFAASRGAHIIAMSADDWFAPHAFLAMLDVACETSADIVFPSVSLDRYDTHRERHSRMLDAQSIALADDGDRASGLAKLVESGLVCQHSGVMYERSLFELCLQHAESYRAIAFLAPALSHAERVFGCAEACFHTAAPSVADSFDPTMFSRLSDDAKALEELCVPFDAIDDDNHLKLACQRFYYGRLVACIENLCLSPHGVSSIERTARLRDMLNDVRTRQMAVALKGERRGLGLLFGPIANVKPMRCVMYAHLAAFLNRTGARIA
ncbi:MAG: glycosyltransferase [Collinsella sp.]|nr:glycosyltransferase [Collinsella sp.]